VSVQPLERTVRPFPPVRLDDPELVRIEYADERRLARRSALYRRLLSGDDPSEVAFATVAALRPRRVLQVGCGRGAFARRIADETGAHVVAVDLSPRMVSLARGLGVDARHGDAQALDFPDEAFDCIVANWVLHHVPGLDAAVAELARVLAPGGSLVATTASAGDLEELWTLVADGDGPRASFTAETGAEILGRRFARVDRRLVHGELVLRDPATARSFVASSVARRHLAARVPDFAGPLCVATLNCVFTATGRRSP
jgi:SAM-dependent methyltransferase